MENRWYPAANRSARVEWDFEDRLVKVTKSDGTVVENVYDVDGVLVRTAVNGVATDYLVDTSGGLSHVVAEIDGSGTVTALYVRAGDMLLEEIRGGVAKMYEADGLGSVRGLLDGTGAKTDTYAYEAFGSTLSSTGSDVNPYRFAGQRLVDGVGFYQNRARWLDTRTGRFVSVDPAEGRSVEPLTLHPYLYGRQSPATFEDPSGREFEFTNMVVGAMNSLSEALSNSIADWFFIRKQYKLGSEVDFEITGLAYDRTQVKDAVGRILKTSIGKRMEPQWLSHGVKTVKIELVADRQRTRAGICNDWIVVNMAETWAHWARSPTTAGARNMSVPRILAHEFGHSALCISGGDSCPEGEKKVIDTVENPLMRELPDWEGYDRVGHEYCDESDQSGNCRE